MAQTYPLDTVIRIVNSNHAVSSPDEQIVVIDVESRKAIEILHSNGRTQLQRVGVFGRFRNRKYFLVANNSDSRNEAEGRVPTFSLRDFARKWTLGLEVNYLASCSSGNEAKVAEALCDGSHPGAVLNESITRWMKDFAGPQPAGLIENYYSRKAEMEAYIVARALDEVGLNLQASLRLESEREALRPIDISPVHFSVRVKDYDEEQDLRLKAEIQVDSQRKIYAILYRHQSPRLGDLLKAETRKYFAANVPLQTFYTGLQTGSLKQNLTDHLNGVLRPFGRRITFISLERKALPPEDDKHAREFLETKQDVSYEIQEYPVPVVIKSTVQMSLVDYALYKNGGSQDLDDWVKRNLAEVIHQVLFGKRYIDLLIGFEPLVSEIKDRLSIRAEAIGYSIKQLITVPDLEPYDWLENFNLEIESAFDTKVPRFPVKLGIIVTTRIRKLQDVESYLNRRQNIPELMKEMIISEARQLLHIIEPERFYMRFGYTDRAGEDPVEKILTDLITNRLTEKFKAEVISVILKMLDTDITAIWSRLESSEGELHINLPSFSDLEDVLYRGTFRVEAIHSNGWDKFRTANAEIGRIQTCLAEHLLAKLGTLSNADLAYTNLEQQKKVEYIIERLAKDFVEQEFGLVIRVNSVRREVTAQEEQEKKRIKEILGALAELENERIAQITVGAPPEKIKATEAKIEKLEAELPASVRATKANFKRLEPLEPAGPTRLPDFFERKSLSAGGRSADSNGGGGDK